MTTNEIHAVTSKRARKTSCGEIASAVQTTDTASYNCPKCAVKNVAGTRIRRTIIACLHGNLLTLRRMEANPQQEFEGRDALLERMRATPQAIKDCQRLMSIAGVPMTDAEENFIHGRARSY